MQSLLRLRLLQRGVAAFDPSHLKLTTLEGNKKHSTTPEGNTKQSTTPEGYKKQSTTPEGNKKQSTTPEGNKKQQGSVIMQLRCDNFS
jgi:hypothetical protein